MRRYGLFLFLLAGACAWAVGAEPPWAYQPLRPQACPAVTCGEWCRNNLDRFILARLEHESLAPSPVASPGTLLRRVSLDLTGLPPTAAEFAEFQRDPSPASYERAVERLLASPHFGERWAAWWLDAARYADTQGYEKDNLRVTWSYRDRVIDAFNQDLPFDRFTVEQLAGDLLLNPTPRQLVATAFHRQTMTNTEGGTDPEEFRIKAVLDRVNTTAQVWLGTTLACAQCHDHPHDPFTQRDYYGLFAIFNNTEDAQEGDDRPFLTLRPLATESRVVELTAQRQQLAVEASSPENQAGLAEVERLLEEIPETTVPILRECATPRPTRLFHRGSWLEPGERVLPTTPAALPAWPATAPRNRLGLAKWIVAPENPLTARVLVNRLWAQLFGQGLLASDDFGTLGGVPSHPELLDDLAWRLRHDWGWSLKRLLREMVLSATYQQSSTISPKLRERDPENRLLARAARFPLPAETLRDQALAVSGLLSPKMYGRSVMPPQPEGFWQVVYNIQRWTPARGEDRYRRSLYTFWRRTSPFPALAALGLPTRESCTTRREPTRTPGAALAQLNDETMVQAAEALGQRMAQEGGASLAEQLRWGYRLLLGEEPSAPTLEALRRVVHATAEQTSPTGLAAAATVLLNTDAAWMHE